MIAQIKTGTGYPNQYNDKQGNDQELFQNNQHVPLFENFTNPYPLFDHYPGNHK